MPRIAYIPKDVQEPRELVQAIRARRGGQLFNLDRMLLHSPPFAEGWNFCLGKVRGSLTLPPKLSELAMCAVASLNGADYEFHHHAPLFEKAGGTRAQVEALRGLANASPPDLSAFTPQEAAVARLTIELTRNVKVADATFDAARSALRDERQVFELVGVIAAYNMVSRILVALGVEPEDD